MATYAPIYRVQLVRDGSAVYDRTPVTTPETAYGLLRPLLEDADREQVIMLGLDHRNRVIGIHTVSVGTLDSAPLSAREVMKCALLMNAAAVILAHNHPSGDPEPSPEDFAVTNQIAAAGKIMSVEVTDHLVIGHGRFHSMRESACWPW